MMNEEINKVWLVKPKFSKYCSSSNNSDDEINFGHSLIHWLYISQKLYTSIKMLWNADAH